MEAQTLTLSVCFQPLPNTVFTRPVLRLISPASHVLAFSFEKWQAINVSFFADPSLRRQRQSLAFNPFAAVLRLAGGNFASFESAPLRIRALYLDDVFGGAALFGSLLASHFVQVGIVQSFKIIGARTPPVLCVLHLDSSLFDVIHVNWI